MRIGSQNTCALSYHVTNKAYQKSGINFNEYLQTENTKADTNKSTPASSGCSPVKSSQISGMSRMLASIDFDPESALRTFQNSFSKVLKDNNIQLSEPASLQCGTDGHIYVTNNTPDKEKIEELFKNNPELENEFRHAAMNAAIAAHYDEALPFYKAYAIDPKAAVAKYSYLFNQNSQDVFSMLVCQGEDGSLNVEPSMQIKRY